MAWVETFQLNPAESEYFREHGLSGLSGFQAAYALAEFERIEYGAPLLPELVAAESAFNQYRAGTLSAQQFGSVFSSYSGFSIVLYGGGGQPAPLPPTPGPSPYPSDGGEWGGLLLLALGAYALVRR
jgi:hypothetical protein